MTEPISMIDIFCHILPEKFKKAFYGRVQRPNLMEGLNFTSRTFPALSDLEQRFRIMEKYEGMREVLSIIHSPMDSLTPADSVELTRIANEEMAELVAKYPAKFIAAIACLPMNNIEAALREAERAIKVLNMKGVQINTPCYGQPLDTPVFFPLYEMMTRFDLPIWVHPTREVDTPDYKGEQESKQRVFLSIGWPWETSVAMVRLVHCGIFEKFPSLKIITHHLGGMIPTYISRLNWVGPQYSKVRGVNSNLSRPPIEYYKMFYADTVVGNNLPALMCGHALFGTERMLFASDIPTINIERAIAPVEQMPISKSERDLIFQGNARKLLHL